MNQRSEQQSLTDEILAQAAELARQVAGIEAEAAAVKAGKAEIAERRKRMETEETALNAHRATVNAEVAAWNTELGEREEKIAARETELKKKEDEVASERRTASNMRTTGGVALALGMIIAVGAAYWASQSRRKAEAEIVQTAPPKQPAAVNPPEVVVKLPDRVVVQVEGPLKVEMEEKKTEVAIPRPVPVVDGESWKNGPGLKLKCAWTAATKSVDCEGADGEGIRQDAQGTYFLAKVSGYQLLSYYIPEQVLGNDIKEDLPFGTLLLDCGVRYVGGDVYAPYCLSEGKPAAPEEFVLPSAQPAPPLAQGIAVQKLHGVNFAWFAEFERKKGSPLCPVVFYAG